MPDTPSSLARTIPPASQWLFFRFNVTFAGRTRKVEVLAPSRELAKTGIGATEGEKITEVKLNATDLAFASKTTSRKAKTAELAMFFKEMERAVHARLGLQLALELMMPAARTPYFRGVLASLHHLTSEKGMRVGDALHAFPDAFSPDQIAMVTAGERSGSEEKTYGALAKQVVNAQRLVGAFKKALIGPCITLGMTALAVLFLHFFVLPKFKENYKGLGLTDLPWTTKVVMDFSDLLSEKPYLFLIPVAGGWFLWSRREKILANPGMQRASLKVPILGPLWRQIVLARSLRTMALMYEASVPANVTYDLVAKTAGHVDYEAYFRKIGGRLSKGSDLYTAFAAERDLIGDDGRVVAGRMRMSAKTGEVSGSLNEVCEILEEEATLKTTLLPELINPIVIVIAASVIGIVAFAITAPNFVILAKALKGDKVF